MAISKIENNSLASGVPSTAKLPAGTVLQVVQATYATQISSSSASPINTGLACSITPTSATSKIIVMSSCQIHLGNSTNTTVYGHFILYRNGTGGTSIFDGTSAELVSGPSTNEYGVRWSYNMVDAPATTSSTTYNLYYQIDAGAPQIINRNNSPAYMILMEIAA